jgi:hypothetical protein
MVTTVAIFLPNIIPHITPSATVSVIVGVGFIRPAAICIGK